MAPWSLSLRNLFSSHYQGLPFNDVYCSSKFALEGLCESLAVLLPPFGVHELSASLRGAVVLLSGGVGVRAMNGAGHRAELGLGPGQWQGQELGLGLAPGSRQPPPTCRSLADSVSLIQGGTVHTSFMQKVLGGPGGMLDRTDTRTRRLFYQYLQHNEEIFREARSTRRRWWR
ncbi:hypothetical protein P7K49_011610 [Saguinus oedipus]|uniref:Uncharacterized protein n=1 Tax=Saguinus oedipus TaxID=9490 RepID=A0ABQ9VSN2_SAGOE|nr:hypothetical protein P7K49_011610 [Saguinus oedipus]